jgi:hypothetical protein
MSTHPGVPASQRAALIDRLTESAPEIAALPVVARTLAAISITCPVLVHFTIDEPVLEGGEMRTLMTYHLADRSLCHDPGSRNEVRGCCLVAYTPGRRLSLSDADAEAFVVDGSLHSMR